MSILYIYRNIVEIVITDIDECDSGTHTCDVNAVCENTQGSYTCTCTSGFTGDGEECKGIKGCCFIFIISPPRIHFFICLVNTQQNIIFDLIKMENMFYLKLD